jgi:DeoR/GlpR family transcriptional regulator of sugar metabolism
MNKPLIPAQRRERIVEYMNANPIARVIDLTQLLNVSEATVRRDLEWLEVHGILERTHGGALLNQRIPLEPEYSLSVQSHPEEKTYIGELAATLIDDGDVIFANSGTTTTEVIRHIRRTGKNVTIVTNNIRSALEAQDADGDLILLGGTYRAKSNSVMGRFALTTLRQIYADKVFVGVDGISLKYGCTVPTHTEAELVSLMLDRTRGPAIVVADHSKWHRVSNFEVGSIDQFDTLITDERLDEMAREELAARSIHVLIAGSVPAVGRA